jgi:hypothetical protein
MSTWPQSSMIHALGTPDSGVSAWLRRSSRTHWAVAGGIELYAQGQLQRTMSLQFGRSGLTDVLGEFRTTAVGVAMTPKHQRCHAGLGRERGMSERYGGGGLRCVCGGVRPAAAGAGVVAGRAWAGGAVGRHREAGCGRGVGGGRVNLLLPAAAARTGGRAAGATCAV